MFQIALLRLRFGHPLCIFPCRNEIANASLQETCPDFLYAIHKMVTRNSRKRARTSSVSETGQPPNPPVSDEYILDQIRVLDSHAQRSILFDAARNHPHILEAIETKAIGRNGD